MAEHEELPEESGEEPTAPRLAGRRLSRSRRVDAEVLWREGFASEDLRTGVRWNDRAGAAKVTVEKLPDVAGDGIAATVTSVSRRTCGVELCDGRLLEVNYSPRLRLTRESLVAAGDNVVVHPAPGSGWILTEIKERRTKLSRPGPDARDHLDIVVAANLDLLVIVASAARPAFHPRFVDRFLIAAQLGGVEPLLFLNKSDLVESDEVVDLSVYQGLGLSVLRGSAEKDIGIAALRERLVGKVSAFAGHSGVGKTSLLNRLVPGALEQVGEVRSKDGRGRHTTTRSSLHRLAEGGRIIDTPGIRELALHRIETSQVQLYFPEIESLFGTCRFNDCLHQTEPGCKVREASEAGAIRPERYASYLRILEGLRAH
ncbi:MAG: putative ribosome biosis GTPase RsgA [Fibrobacterota bacterium]|jgi:ribosome biogenesis GTPase